MINAVTRGRGSSRSRGRVRRVSGRAGGFTLLEVLATMLLLTILLVGVYSGIRTTTRLIRSGTASSERLDQIRSAQRLLRREITQTMAVPIGRDDHDDNLFFDGAARRMRYVAPLPGYLGKLGAQLQTLELVDDRHGALRLQMQLALMPPDGSPPKPLGKPQVLLDHIHAGGFFYRGLDTQGNPGKWQSAWPDGRLLPSLVRIELKPLGREGWPQLDVPLRIDPASGMIQAAQMHSTPLPQGAR